MTDWRGATLAVVLVALTAVAPVAGAFGAVAAAPAAADRTTDVGDDDVGEQATGTVGEATVSVTPDDDINASTYGTSAFTVSNTGDANVESVRIDLSTAVLPDLVYDPNGTAGDLVAKEFSLDSGGSATGVQGHTLETPHDGNSDDGYDVLVVTFDDFQPGETVTFSIDVDPTSIKGVEAPGPADSGSVSGLEMVGSTVTVQFADGTASAPLFSVAGSPSEGFATVRAGAPAAPGLDVQGASLSSTTLSPDHEAATVSSRSQTVVVSGPAGADVRLLRVEGGQYLDGVPDGGFDIEAYEANTARAVQEYTATIESDGDVTVPVTLTETDPEAGYNYFVAVVEDASGTGETSTVVVATVSESLFTEPLPGSGGEGPPQDANGDGVIEDLNGDGVEDFDDVITLAFSLDADLTAAQTAALDYDGDGSLGFGDVVELAFSL